MTKNRVANGSPVLLAGTWLGVFLALAAGAVYGGYGFRLNSYTVLALTAGAALIVGCVALRIRLAVADRNRPALPPVRVAPEPARTPTHQAKPAGRPVEPDLDDLDILARRQS